MISLKGRIGFLMALSMLVAAGNWINNFPCNAEPLRRLAKIERAEQKAKFVMYSSAFKNGEKLPTHFTADEANVSPPLSWAVPPAGTKSFALICEDPDAPRGTWIHWLIYDIPSEQKGLKQGISAEATLSDGTKQGITSFNKVGYGGPSPPPGKPHRYYFKLYALNSMSNLPPATDLKSLQAVVKAHSIAESDLMGTYGR